MVELYAQQARDVEQLHEILVECGFAMQRQFDLHHWVPAYPLDLFRQQAERGQIYEVVSGASIVATFTLRFDEPLPYYEGIDWDAAGEPALYLSRLAVRPDSWGNGIGSWCVEWIERKARELEARSVRFDAYSRHAPLLSYYRKRGYRECGRCLDPEIICFEKTWG